ncbi:16S rRNA (cytidine1402-2'-O)-methyltransferase [Azospirillum fermentarium]|uniref:16S rRNA (cytidine(1402)-2'-O)-methyltransferase n=1 Tax=Azospirillum fermentarium TaxID=1233114 RepID=UPI00222702B1|nr:16S rRNA (cytidine(1402)-2'-O)-methyltransferase [Azospirillum fermentarium]MCW2244641.1 16S rRNA (cytidine1402-2'-O)-methyltransferase [Azospirillum fermentarium]
MADDADALELPSPAPGKPLAPGLYLVATPIGNAADITLRALDTLKRAAAVACEDTRVTGRLMTIHGVPTPLVPYHEHNAARMRPQLIRRMQGGEAIALVSDAGTPLVSDPGYKLVRECVEAGVAVTTLPGPSAPLSALLLSGLPSDRFLFAGFLPNKSAARRTAIAEVKAVPATLIFFDSAQRLAASLADLAAVLGPRPAAVARELTKLYEEVRRGPLDALAAHYEQAGPPRGEIVIVVGGPSDDGAEGVDLDTALRDALSRLSVRDATAAVTALTGMPKREVYARALELSREGGEGA